MVSCLGFKSKTQTTDSTQKRSLEPFYFLTTFRMLCNIICIIWACCYRYGTSGINFLTGGKYGKVYIYLSLKDRVDGDLRTQKCKSHLLDRYTSAASSLDLCVLNGVRKWCQSKSQRSCNFCNTFLCVSESRVQSLSPAIPECLCTTASLIQLVKSGPLQFSLTYPIKSQCPKIKIWSSGYQVLTLQIGIWLVCNTLSSGRLTGTTVCVLALDGSFSCIKMQK